MPKKKQNLVKQAGDAEAAAPKPSRQVPTWLRRVACFAAALFCAFGVVYSFMVLLVGKGSPIFIVAIVVFAALAVHMVRAGLADGRWRTPR